MKVIMIRHTSVAVGKGVCYGQTDVPLSSTFEKEAENVRLNLEKYCFDFVFTSPLSRCSKLAAYCGYPDAEKDSRLMEMNFGKWEMQRFDEITDPRLQKWYDDYMNVVPTGGESSRMQCERLVSFIDDLKAQLPPSAVVAVFTHGGILIHALAVYGGLTYEDAFASSIPYGSIIELEI